MMTVADIDAAAPTAGVVSAGAPPPAPSRLRERVGKVGFALRTTLTGIALLVLLALLWEGYKAFGQHYDDHFFNTSWELPVATDDLAMPHVRDIIGALFEPVQRGSDQMLISSLIGSAMRTLVTAAAGLAIAFAVGFGLALLLLRFTPLRQGLTPWIVASQTVPLVAIAPMIVIWVGKANLPPWFAVASISAYLAFFPITVNTLRGLRSAAPAEVELMRSYAAGETSTLLYLRIPTALPLMFTGLRLAATAAVVGAIVGELSAGTVRGIGNDLLTYSYFYTNGPEKLYCAVLVAALVGIFFVQLIALADRFALRNRVRR
jgi:NitT/TauT family transport system permease protein